MQMTQARINIMAAALDREQMIATQEHLIATAEPAVAEAETDWHFDPLANVLARQSSIPLSIPKGVALIGCGGVGSWLGYFLALAGVPKLLLFDGDKVSESNLNRLPYGAAWLAKAKTLALASTIQAIRPQCKVECYPNFGAKFASALELQKNIDWLAVSTDTWSSRKEVFEWYGNAMVPLNYIEASAEGEFGSVTGSPAEFATEDENSPGYASVPVWVGPSVSSAVMACAHILHGANIGSTCIRPGWDASRDCIEFNQSPEPEEV